MVDAGGLAAASLHPVQGSAAYIYGAQWVEVWLLEWWWSWALSDHGGEGEGGRDGAATGTKETGVTGL